MYTHTQRERGGGSEREMRLALVQVELMALQVSW